MKALQKLPRFPATQGQRQFLKEIIVWAMKLAAGCTRAPGESGDDPDTVHAIFLLLVSQSEMTDDEANAVIDVCYGTPVAEQADRELAAREPAPWSQGPLAELTENLPPWKRGNS